MPHPDVVLVAPYPTAGRRHAGPTGVASYTANLAHALYAQGAAVHVVAPEEPDEPNEPRHSNDGGIVVHRRFRRGPVALLHATRAAADLGAPVVHLQHELFLYGGVESAPAVVGALAQLRRRQRAVVTMHQVVDPDEVDRNYTRVHRVHAPTRVVRTAVRALQHAIVGLADACVVHEHAFADIVPRTVVIPHGIEQPQLLPREEARTALGVDDRFVVLCFGFMSPYKGLEVCLDAGRIAGDDVLVVIAGGSHPRLAAGDDPYAAELQQRFEGPNARFTGWVPDRDVGLWHAAADVAVLAYPRPFASSGALALAIAHRTPALLSSAMARCVGAHPLLSVPNDPTALAQRLRALADDRDACDALARATALLSSGRTWPAVAQAHLQLYERVLD
jgi:glycosyltransferase involved in cell wall biosynthesis